MKNTLKQVLLIFSTFFTLSLFANVGQTLPKTDSNIGLQNDISLNNLLPNPTGILLKYNRKGLVFSIGIGTGFYREEAEGFVTSRLQTHEPDPVENLGLYSDITFGYGFNNQFLIYCFNKANWRFESYANADTDIFISYLQGFGTSYFFKEMTKSPFVSAGLGIAALDVLNQDTEKTNGFGFFLGGGYQFEGHFLVQVDMIFGRPDVQVLEEKISYKTFSFNVSFCYFFY